MSSAVFPASLRWSQTGSGHFRLRATLAPGLPEGALDALADLLRAFLGVASFGGFAPSDGRPEASTVRGVAEKRPFERVLEVMFEAERVDSRAFLVLQNALLSFGEDVHPVESLQVEPVGAVSGIADLTFPETTWEREDRAYPARAKSLPFPVEFEAYQDNRKARRCLIDLGPGRADGLEPLSAAVRSWAALVDACGFAPPVADSREASVVVGTLAPMDDCSLEIVFALFDSSEAAWNVLLNLLSGFARKAMPVASVTIS